MDGAPHPNAAKLFVNWLLTQEGMQSLVDNLQTGVIRTDVNYAKVPPDDVPSASGSYFDDCTMDYNTTERVQLNDKLKTLLGR
jgi:ABC-type Fe3+ transport system substrate-binding protein